MEQIISFLEQYWGQSIIGTLTLGTIITFIVTQIKVGIRDKVKNKNVDVVISKADSLCVELNEREKRREEELKQLENKIEIQRKEIQRKEDYFEKVQATTFQAISYLVIASKLPTEDKIALQNNFTTLINNKVMGYKKVLKDEVQPLKDEVVNKIIPDATQTVTATIEETKSLLDKYMKEG